MSVLARLLTRPEPAAAGTVMEPMRTRHLNQILRIEQASYPKPWSRGVFESELQLVGTGTRDYVVAKRGRRVAGYAGLWIVPDPSGDTAHVTNVAVDPELRRAGIGTALMCELARRAIGRDCVAWTLEVRVSSTGAQELYRTFGFVPAGVRRKYYENSEDAIVMWCHDIGSADYRARLEALACPT
jgi:[ribosomal protein S18]-alanine N-acetyltransferase